MRAFRLAYEGQPYHGFQRQPDVPTVERALFDAIAALGLESRPPPGYTAAGRTDAGVSALAQTVAFECPSWCTPRALNAELPDDIRAWAMADVDPSFHATRDARYREYAYYLHTAPLDVDAVRAGADRFSGEHDFRNLTPDDEATVRDVSVRVHEADESLVVTVGAGGFPRALVRRIVSVLSEVGSGTADLSRVDRVLDPKPLPGHEGVTTAPPYPLVLTRVEYDASFEVDADAAETARERFRDRSIEYGVRARVMARIAGGVTPDSPGDRNVDVPGEDTP